MSTHHSGATSPKGRRHDVVAEEKRQFGGMKFGAAFFGWMTAVGITVLLTALISAIGVVIGALTDTNASLGSVQPDSGTLQTMGIVGAIVLALILFAGYYCGGYVAGRMARFDGLKQGLAVWLWAVIVAVVLAVIGLIAGSQFNVLDSLSAFPRIPVNEGTLTTGAIISLVIAALIALAGALLGGKAGMHFHRKVDQAGFEA